MTKCTILASVADRGKRRRRSSGRQQDRETGRQGGDNNRCVHVIGHLVDDPEVHGYESVHTRLDLKMNVHKHEQMDCSFVIIFCYESGLYIFKC